MAVIPFHLSIQRQVAANVPSGSPGVLSRTLGRMGLEELEALTTFDFSICIQTDADNGTAIFNEWDEAKLVQYLKLHGLRLPSAVHAVQLLELCNDLRWAYGRVVRLAARGGDDLAVMCPGLSREKMEYVWAVGSQNLGAAREMARKVIRGRGKSIFLH